MSKAGIYKWIKALYLLSLAILSACGQIAPATPTLAPTAIPTASPTSTLTPIPTNTSTPEPTPTRAVRQFKICSAEDWKNCYISLNELSIYGDYYRWVSESWNPDLPTPDPGDTSKYKIAWDKTGGAMYLINHQVTDEKPFAAGFTYGYTKCDVTLARGSTEMTCAVVPVAIAVPGRPGETKKVIGLMVQAFDASDAEMTRTLKQIERMDVLMLTGFSFNPETRKASIAGNDTIEFFGETIRHYPDLFERFAMFQETLDPTFISEPGLLMDIPAVYKK